MLENGLVGIETGELYTFTRTSGKIVPISFLELSRSAKQYKPSIPLEGPVLQPIVKI